MDAAENNTGYVYILKVKDLDLSVCKIGMTTRTPHERCDEINKSSTGDFLWSVAHYIAVDNCQKLESLVHARLSPFRQRGREIFQMHPDAASENLMLIFESQDEIKISNLNDSIKKCQKSKSKKQVNEINFSKRHEKHIELLQAFTSSLNVKGKPFGQPNQPFFGMSDGCEGVQWNIVISTDDKGIRLGVNLEGIKYKNWPISKFILSERKNPTITKIKAELDNPNEIFIRFSRDAWQAASRPSIVEKFIEKREYSFSECTPEQWSKILNEALECLNEEKEYCGRATQVVTLEGSGQAREMEVSPHLTIWSYLNPKGDVQENMQKKFEELRPVYVSR